ncbi:MAG: HEAT repeat domain-containing protein [Polyangiaceae bacterium]
MGFFDLFKGGNKSNKGGEGPSKAARDAARFAERAGDKRAQTYDRQEAIQALADMGTPEAAAALLKRFTFVIDPSITDQDEKEVAFNGVLKAGPEAIPAVRHFAATAESLAWPMKVVKALVEEDAYVEELLLWLSKWDTEYAKFVDPKVQLLVMLEEHKHEKIREAVKPFLLDVHEPARYHAVTTTFAQDDVVALPDILETLGDEESFRIRNKIADCLIEKAWAIPEDKRAETRKSLPSGYTIDGEGFVRKRE